MTEVKKRIANDLVYDGEGFRMSTPTAIAEYKAERLRTESIADLGSGVGIQALHFAESSTRVAVIDIDPKMIDFCRRNAKIMGLTNMDFIVGNAADVEIVKEVGDVQTIHSDPSRDRKGDAWSLSDLSPDPLELAGLYRADKMSFDIPSFMRSDLVPNEWELEYISLQGELKRLSTYVGGAKRFEKSAVSLPSGERVVFDRDLQRDVERETLPKGLLYEVDGSLGHAGLLPEFLRGRDGLSILYEDSQKTIMTSEKHFTSPFIIKSYSLLGSAESLDGLKSRLREERAGKAILRFPIDPGLYYDTRKEIERGLDGDRTLFVFRFRDEFFIAERHPISQSRVV